MGDGVPTSDTGRKFNWTREETVLAADVYVNRLGRKLPSNDDHSEVIALSNLLR